MMTWKEREAHWAKVHVRSDSGPPVKLPDRLKRVFTQRGGTRYERGGFKFNEGK